MNKNLKLIFKKKKIYKITLYFFLFIVIIFFSYFSIPKFLNYTPKLIEESLKKNNNLNIKDISNINYRIFPSPRLNVSGSTLELEDNVLEVKGVKIDIILNPLSLINYKKFDYDRVLIKGESIDIKINKVNRLLNYINKNEKKINFKENTIFILKENKKLFKINKGTIKINSKYSTQQLSINGLFLNYKIKFLLENESEKKTNIILNIPELDISTKISLRKKDNFRKLEGLVNFVVLNNFFQFNFIKEKEIRINKGYTRNNLINSSFEGSISFKPHFFFDLDIKPSTINIKKLFPEIQRNFFSENSQGAEIIKKINGSLNFRNILKGKVIFENGEILFQNFSTNKNNPILFDAKISEFGKKGKIKFNFLKNIQYKENFTKELKISGFMIPESSKVVFTQVLLDKKTFTAEKIKNYEERFKYEVINNSLSNIFNEIKINNFLKNFVN